ncbi:MAG TPA: glycosyltransferase family 4 protein [Ignavibacteria bacterium]|nr:glycosyltransferase family 4 protein [Ignavibacteria bacterium]
MKKVLIISYYWPPSGGAGVQRMLKSVKYFPGFGIIPYVITVKEEQASYPSKDESLNKDVPAEAKIFRTDTFEPFGIYSKLLGKKSIPTGFSNESNPGLFQKCSRFIRGNFFIPDARRGWIKFAFEEAARIIEKENIDTVFTTSPPHSAQLIGLKLKKKFGVKWIADLRDPWTDIYYYEEFNHLSFARKKDLKYENEVLTSADRIITVSKDVKRIFASKSDKIDPDKITIIPNGYDGEDFKNKNIFPEKDEFIITYTGTLADSYNPSVFFHSLKKVTEMNPDVKIKMRFIGNPAGTLIEEIRNISLSNNLELIPTVIHDRSVEYLLSSTILFLVIPEIKNDKGILTGKLFEYLAARKPIVCIGPEDGDAAEIINECIAGKTFERTRNTELTEYLDGLVKDWKTGKDISVKNDTYKKYSRRSQAEELSKIIMSV